MRTSVPWLGKPIAVARLALRRKLNISDYPMVRSELNHSASRKVAIFIGIAGALGAITLVIAASAIVSNVLNIGTPNLNATKLAVDVSLVSVDKLPPDMRPNRRERARFNISSTSAYPSAKLKLRIGSSRGNLADPSIADVIFKHPDTGDEGPVTLSTAAGGVLEADLLSGWSIPASYSSTAELVVTFKDKAPPRPYSFDVWVEADDGLTGATGAITEVSATDDRVFFPQDLTITLGDTVRWTNSGNTPHTITFSDGAVPSLNLFAGRQTYEVTFSKAGTFHYLCQFHSDMVGSITVTP